MKNKKEMLDLFQVEELEKRYEMGWVKIRAQEFDNMPCADGGCDADP